MHNTEQILTLSKSAEVEVAETLSHFPEEKKKSALLRLLHIYQKENGGWLSTTVMDQVAEFLNIKPIEVYEVASFYTMYNLKPVGKVVFEFCRTGPCCTRGVEEIITYTENKLGIKTGETTADGIFTLKQVECLGACGYAPMMQIGESFEEFLTHDKIDELITNYRSKLI